MTKEYAQSAYNEASAELNKWREVYESQTKWNAKKRVAAEQIEFWSNKKAFLDSAR